VQSISGEDMAAVAIGAAHRDENLTIEAFGRETMTFRKLVETIARTIHSRARIVPAPAPLAIVAASAIGWMVGDVTLTQDEARGLMMNLLVGPGAPNGDMKFTDWVAVRSEDLGRQYASEIGRHFK
jgi:uncharacterized protein YbjT (DUF2867 family)